jgi:hypothetical protein
MDGAVDAGAKGRVAELVLPVHRRLGIAVQQQPDDVHEAVEGGAVQRGSTRGCRGRGYSPVPEKASGSEAVQQVLRRHGAAD